MLVPRGASGLSFRIYQVEGLAAALPGTPSQLQARSLLTQLDADEVVQAAGRAFIWIADE